MLFLVRIVVRLPADLPEAERRDLLGRELVRGRELVVAGLLRAIWRIPGQLANWSVYDVPDADALHEALASLPLFPWVEATVHPLATHPVGVTSLDLTPTAESGDP